MGGAVALEMALQRPMRVPRLALINSLASYRDQWRKWVYACTLFRRVDTSGRHAQGGADFCGRIVSGTVAANTSCSRSRGRRRCTREDLPIHVALELLGNEAGAIDRESHEVRFLGAGPVHAHGREDGALFEAYWSGARATTGDCLTAAKALDSPKNGVALRWMSTGKGSRQRAFGRV
jgi:pimeloyl-ACP methyl ester carboxylesterase